MATAFKVKGKIWLWPGEAAWHFVNVDEQTSLKIKELASKKKRKGFGSVPVEVTLGKTKWKTSIFPDSRSGTYLLPLKLKVRMTEGVAHGDVIVYTLRAFV